MDAMCHIPKPDERIVLQVRYASQDMGYWGPFRTRLGAILFSLWLVVFQRKIVHLIFKLSKVANPEEPKVSAWATAIIVALVFTPLALLYPASETGVVVIGILVGTILIVLQNLKPLKAIGENPPPESPRPEPPPAPPFVRKTACFSDNYCEGSGI